MDSLLSEVFECLSREFLESGPFRLITPLSSYYFRNIDNILLKYPRNIALTKITDNLNILNFP